MVDFRIGTGNPVNFFQKVTVTNTGFGASATNFKPDIVIPFTTSGVVFLNEGGGTIQLSFDGYNIHDELGTSPLLPSITYYDRVACKIWLKVASGSATFSVRAWSIR
jgi:hypothetical protein